MIDLAQKLVALSQQMLTQAEAEQWEAVAETQAKRAEIIAQLESGAIETTTQAVSAQLETLLLQSRQLEKQCQALAEARRSALASDQGKLSKGRAMRKAYGANK